MRLTTMVGRVAVVQTVVTLVALGVVVLVTATGITLLLARRADRALDDLLRAHGTRSRWRSPGLTWWRSWTTRNV